MQCTVAQLAASKAELGSLQSAREKLARELESLKGENKALLQRSALADSLSAEADALRQQVTAPWNYYQSLQGSSSRVSRGFCPVLPVSNRGYKGTQLRCNPCSVQEHQSLMWRRSLHSLK